MIHVGAVLDTFELGGVELACLELLRRLDPARFRSSIYTFRPGVLVERARAAGFSVLVGHDKPAADSEWRARDTRARRAWTRKLAEAMRADGIDVCFVWGWPEAIDAARTAGVRPIVERVDGPSLVGRVGDKSACTRVVCQSQTVHQLLVAQRERFRLDPARIEIIHNGVDLARFDQDAVDPTAARESLGLPVDAFVVGTVARLAPEKNLAQLVRAFAAAAETSRRVAAQGWLVMCGPDGGSRADLEREVDLSGLRRRVLFTGPVADTERVLATFDLFCLTSFTEGTPAALLEAMAMARPIVATPVGGVLEMVDGNAILVDVMAPRATAEAIVELAGDEPLRRRMGERSRALAGGWSIKSSVARYEQVLEAAWREAKAAA